MSITEKLATVKEQEEKEILKAIRNHENISRFVTVSMQNSKMGKIPSVSLLPVFTCSGRCVNTCMEKCYAVKLCRIRPVVARCYARNTAVAKYAPRTYWKVINNAAKNARFFRFHVSGDIMNNRYFQEMVKTARKNPHCQFLAFTKQYEIVNLHIECGDKIPGNLKIMFSGWENLTPYNPHNFPETNVYRKTADKKTGWIPCGGNCLNCAVAGCGCWNAKNGETIAFKMH